MSSIKLLVSAYESSGKSTLTSTIKDALVINFDRKEYGFNVPHANFTNYEGMGSVINFINEKIKKYKESFNTLPKVVVLDTVTQLYSAMARYNGNKYTFTIRFDKSSYSLLGKDNWVLKQLQQSNRKGFEIIDYDKLYPPEKKETEIGDSVIFS